MHSPSLLSLPLELKVQIALEVASNSRPGPPSDLVSLLLTHSSFNDAFHFDANPSFYSDLLHYTWDTAAIGRRWGEGVLRDKRVGAKELRKRWKLLKRIRAGGASRGGTTAWAEALEAERERAGRDLLAVWLLLSENDSQLNLGHVLLFGDLPDFILAYHQGVILPTALLPDVYPRETIDATMHVLLGTYLDELGHEIGLALQDVTDVEPLSEPLDQVDEKLFVLRPFALALFKYQTELASWDRPLASRHGKERESTRSSCELSSLAPLKIKRFGKEWQIRAPLLSFSAIQGLLNQLDRTPNALSAPDDPVSASNSSTRCITFLYTGFDAPNPRPPPNYYDKDHGSLLLRSIPRIQLHSKHHDLDIKRALLCNDPSTSPSPLGPFGGVRGKLEGVWHGSYAFFDFTGYREMLAGKESQLYEAGVGQQGQELVLTETVVRVPVASFGGSGSPLNAGYPAADEDPDPVETYFSIEDEEKEEEDGSGFAKELLISGWGRSQWGECRFYGRVRAWDGLIMLVKEYSANALHKSKWIYRGYLHCDSRFVGVWRDTFSEVGSQGYESGFCCRKQAPAFLVPNQRIPQEFEPRPPLLPPPTLALPSPPLATEPINHGTPPSGMSLSYGKRPPAKASPPIPPALLTAPNLAAVTHYPMASSSTSSSTSISPASKPRPARPLKAMDVGLMSSPLADANPNFATWDIRMNSLRQQWKTEDDDSQK